MTMTLGEMRELERRELTERRWKEKDELSKRLKEIFIDESIEVISIVSDGDFGYKVGVAFTIDNFRQGDIFYWVEKETMEDFIGKVKNNIEYIKELREQYPDYCKQNDFIQSNSKFKKEIILTHLGYEKKYYLNLQLADYLKLPNTTDCSFGGGDYEIKRTPQRVKEYNENIDKTIDVLLDSIVELKQMKYKG